MFGDEKIAENTANALVNNFTNQDVLACLKHLGKSINICFEQLAERDPGIRQVFIIAPLENEWKYIKTEKVGRNRWIHLTEEGKWASEFLI